MWDTLYFIKDYIAGMHTKKTARIFFGHLGIIWIFKRNINIVFENMSAQGGFAGLTRSSQCYHWIFLSRI